LSCFYVYNLETIMARRKHSRETRKRTMIAHVGRPRNVVALEMPDPWKARVRDALDEFARQGVTNEMIAKRVGISKGLLSKMVREGGDMRVSAHAEKLGEAVAVPLPTRPLTERDANERDLLAELRLLSQPAYEQAVHQLKSITQRLRKETKRRLRLTIVP
jgi:hypothetical protein